MSKTESKKQIIKKIIGNISNTISIINKEGSYNDDVITNENTKNGKESDVKYEYIEKSSLENENYLYLDDDDLSRDITLNREGLKRDLNIEYNLSICIYKINRELRTPFLEFYFEKKDFFYQFPETKLLFNNIHENSDIDTYFLDECSRLYNSKSDKPIENISEIYKGFVEIGNNNIIVVLENPYFIKSNINDTNNHLEKSHIMNNETIQDETDNKTSEEEPENETINQSPEEEQNEHSLWAILDEIIVKKRILDIPIKDYILEMFNVYQVLNIIKDSTNYPIETPIILFQCNGTYKNYENNYYNEIEDRSKSISIIDERIEHDIFGNIYLFSTEPLEYDNLSKIKRYAAFINNTLYMLNKKNITKEELVGDETDISKLPFKTYHCISFNEDEKDYWSINTNQLFVEL
jgi:hypothetical protein